MTNIKAILQQVAKKIASAILHSSGAMAHKTTVDWNCTKHIKCNAGEMIVLHQCSNNFYKIKTTDAEGYFRPVLPHTDLNIYVKNAIEYYFTTLYPEQKIEWECVQETISNKKRYKELLHMGSYSDPHSPAWNFMWEKDTTLVGIETPSSLEYHSEAWNTFVLNINHFLKYVMNTIRRHQRNSRGGKWEFSNANRQMATEAMARLIGLDYMFPHSEFVVITTPEGNQMRGTLMENARGESTEAISTEFCRAVCSPILQRELSKLNVLDLITYERDHRPGNYNIILDEKGKVSGLSVFDNDAEMTFAPMTAATHSGSGCNKLIGRGINRPHMDAELAKRIMHLDKKDIQMALMPYLNKIQVQLCWCRIVSLKKAIKISSRRKGFLLKHDQWTEDTIAEELSGKYGRTYLDTFVNYEEYIKSFNNKVFNRA